MSSDEQILIIDRLPLINDMRVIVHPLKLGELKLKNGAIVEIKSVESGNVVYAPIQAASNDDYDESDQSNLINDLAPRYGFIQMSRTLRTNLQCYLGQTVQIKKAKINDPAECVVLAPIDDTISVNQEDSTNCITGTYADILFQFDFRDLPIFKDEVIPIYTLNRIIEFKVVLTQPSNIVVIKNVDTIACRNTTVPRGNSPRFDAINYDDIGGLHLPIRKIRQIIELPLLQPKIYRSILKNGSVKATIKDLLIIANSGCGKTLISEAIKNETPTNYLRINCYDLLTKNVEQAIAFLLKSIDDAVTNQPAIIYFDDFDAVSCPEINESAQPDNRLSNALCSALKRMRAEKGVIVIASVRDDSRIKKDIKMKFDRKITIPLPVANEKLSIIRSISFRHPVDLPSILNSSVLSNHLMNGKTSGQIKMTMLRYISRSLSELASAIKKEKKRRKKKSDVDEEFGDTSTFSINQLKKVNVTNQIIQESISLDSNQNDVDSLFEDTSFDNPESYDPLKKTQDDCIDMDGNASKTQDELLYDPEYSCYFSAARPIRHSKPKGKGETEIDFIDLFGEEPLYNEGMVDDFDQKGKNRYRQDDYSDDLPSKKKGTNKKDAKTRKRFDDYYDYYYDYYYDDYYDYDYYDDDDDRKSKSKPKQKRFAEKKPAPERNKPVQSKKGNKKGFSDPFGSRNENKKKQTAEQLDDSSENIETKSKSNPFNSTLNDDSDTESSTSSVRGKPFGKVERKDPFAEESSKPKKKKNEEDDFSDEPRIQNKRNQQRNNSKRQNPFGDVNLSEDDESSSTNVKNDEMSKKKSKQRDALPTKKVKKESEDEEEKLSKGKNKKKIDKENDFPKQGKRAAFAEDSSSEEVPQKRRIRRKNPFQ